MTVLAHFGKIDAAGATTFGWMTLAMALIAAAGVVAARIRKGEKPYFAGLIAGVPFAIVSLWSFSFAFACRVGAPPQKAWTVVIVGVPTSVLALASILRWINRGSTRTARTSAPRQGSLSSDAADRQYRIQINGNG